ncbi:retrotransposon protein, putative, ty1-copia subclass [Tanacetum coccineum]
MVRKPFSHQTEIAKDLLGLIHTNVSGPIRTMSREGASYFITFTDNFSRYGYGYLMKHKHEVFETFKGYALESATWIFNMVQPRRLTTPYESWHEKSPKLSTRIPQAPDRYGFYVDAEEHELGDVNQPPNYKVALLDSEFDKWVEVMNAEVQSMKDNKV